MTDADLRSQHEAISKQALAFMARDERLPYISAFVMASDTLSGEANLERLTKGEITFAQALLYTGSYARLDLVVNAHDRGLASRDEVLDALIEYWSGSDPDDTDERFLRLWYQAWERNGNRHVTDPDGRDLPSRKRLTIYRGQDLDAPLGIAWSLSQRIAQKFAMGAATRQANRDGVILKGTVERIDVLAFLTDRGEQEVIVDPDTVTVIR